jgi:hypothetical protein
MVRAILKGRKTQTRRVVKGPALQWLKTISFTPNHPNYVSLPENELSPYGCAGDRLWIEETSVAYGHWDAVRHGKASQRVAFRRLADRGRCRLSLQSRRSRHSPPNSCFADLPHAPVNLYALTPRAASRITLEVTAVVSRLQISARKTRSPRGIERDGDGWRAYRGGPCVELVTMSYATSLEAINAVRGYGWQSNPWVWVVKLRSHGIMVYHLVKIRY